MLVTSRRATGVRRGADLPGPASPVPVRHAFEAMGMSSRPPTNSASDPGALAATLSSEPCALPDDRARTGQPRLKVLNVVLAAMQTRSGPFNPAFSWPDSPRARQISPRSRHRRRCRYRDQAAGRDTGRPNARQARHHGRGPGRGHIRRTAAGDPVAPPGAGFAAQIRSTRIGHATAANILTPAVAAPTPGPVQACRVQHPTRQQCLLCHAQRGGHRGASRPLRHVAVGASSIPGHRRAGRADDRPSGHAAPPRLSRPRRAAMATLVRAAPRTFAVPVVCSRSPRRHCCHWR